MSVDAGTLHLGVEADTSGLTAGLQRRLDTALAGIRARIRADLDASRLVTQAQAAAKAAEQAASMRVRLTVDRKALADDLRSALDASTAASAAQVRLTLDRRSLTSDLRAAAAEACAAVRPQLRVEVQADTKPAAAAVDAERARQSGRPVRVPVDADTARAEAQVEGARRRQSGREVRVPVSFVTNAEQVARVSQSFAKLGKLDFITAGAAPAIAALGSVAAGLTAVVSAAAPAVGSLAAVGSAGLALGQGMATVKIAMGGVGDAYKAYSGAQAAARNGEKLTEAQTQALAAAMNQLPPAARGFIREAEAMSQRLLTVRTAVQGALLPQLGDAMVRLGSLIPTVQTGLAGTARVIGDLAVRGAQMVTSGPWRADFATLLAGNTRLIASFGAAGLSLADVLRNTAVAALPLAQRFADFAARGAATASAFLEAQRGSEGLDRFFRLAGDTAAQLGRILGNTVAALVGMGRAALPAGQILLGSLEGVTRKAREFTASLSGQNQMRAYFMQAVPALQETGRLVAALAATLVRLSAAPNVAPLIAQVRTQLLPAVERLLFISAATFGPALIRLLTNLADVFTRLSSQGGALIGFVNTLSAISGGLSRLLAVPGLGEFVSRILTLAGAAAALGLVAGRVLALGGAIARVAGPLTTFATWFARLLVFGNPFALAAAGAVALGAVLYAAYQRVTPFREFINGLGDVLRARLLPALSALGAAVSAVFGGRFGEARAKLGEFVTGVGATVAGLAQRIGPALLNAGRALVSWIVTAVPQAVTALGGFIGRAVEAVRSGAPRLASAALALGASLVGWVARTIPPLLGDLGRWIGAAVSWVAGTGLPRLAAAAGRLAGALGGWVARTVPPLLADLGRFIAAAATWVVGTGLPRLAAATARLAGALGGWVARTVPRLLGDLAEFIGRAAAWIIGTGYPRLVVAAYRLAGALLGWVLTTLPRLLLDLGKLVAGAVAWIVTRGVPMLAVGAAKLAAGLLGWVLPRIPGLIADVAKLIGAVVSWVFTRGVPMLVGGLLELGRRAVKGFIDGFKQTDIGRAILPALDGVRRAVATAWEAVRSATVAAFTAVRNVVGPAWAAVRSAITGAISGIAGAVGAAWGGIQRATSTAFNAVRSVATTVWNGVLTAIKVALTAVGVVVYLAWRGVQATTSGALNVLRRLIDVVWRAIPVPIQNALRVAGAAVAAGWAAMQRATSAVFGAIQRFLSATWTFISRLFSTTATAIARGFQAWWDGLRRVANAVFGAISSFMSATWGAIRQLWDSAMAAVRRAWDAYWNALSSTARRLFAAISSFIGATWAGIRRVWDAAQAAIRRAWDGFWSAVSGAGRRAFDGIKGTVDSTWRAIRGIWDRAQGGIRSTWDTFWTGVKKTGSDAINSARGTIDRVLGQIKSSFDTAKDNIRRTWDGLKGVVSGPIDFLRQSVYNGVLVPVWNRIAGLVNGPKLTPFAGGGYVEPYRDPSGRVHTGSGPGLALARGGVIERAAGRVRMARGGIAKHLTNTERDYRSGGKVPGYAPYRDKVRALLSPGEGVLVPEATQGVGGAPAIAALNTFFRSGSKAAAATAHAALNRVTTRLAHRGDPAAGETEFPPGLTRLRLPGFAGGGVAPDAEGRVPLQGGGVIDWIKDKVGAGAGAVGNAIGAVKEWVYGGLRNAAAAALGPVRALITRGLTGSPLRETVRDVALKGLDSLLKRAQNEDEGGTISGVPFTGGLTGRSGAYGGVKPHVAAVGDLVKKMFGVTDIGGVAGRPGNYSDHPSGHALDFMSYANRGLGNRVAGFLQANWRKFAVKYLIWYDRIASSPGAWRPYTHPSGNRTNPTLRHLDHVHASFLRYAAGPTGPNNGSGLVREGGQAAPGLAGGGLLDRLGRVASAATGGVVRPRPGGTLVRVAERGRAEAITDAGLLNARLTDMGHVGQLARALLTQLVPVGRVLAQAAGTLTRALPPTAIGATATATPGVARLASAERVTIEVQHADLHVAHLRELRALLTALASNTGTNITVNNPTPEPASESVNARLRRLAVLGP